MARGCGRPATLGRPVIPTEEKTVRAILIIIAVLVIAFLAYKFLIAGKNRV